MSTPYGIQALTGELNKLARATPGDRNNTLNEVWLKLCHVIGAGHLDKIETAQQVYDTARSIGLEDAEIRATMASASNGARTNPRQRQAPQPAIDLTGLTPDSATSTPAEPVADYDHLYLARSGLASLPQPEPLIDGVLDEHTLFAVTGRDRSYKSFLVLDWLACLATGKRWQDHPAKQTKILYVVGEGAYGLDARLTAWEAAWQPVEDQWFHVRRAPVNLFKRAADVADLYERIGTEQYGVVVFDTLQRMSAGAETNYDRDAGTIIETMDLLRRANDRLAVGVVAHTQKGDDDIRGSSAFEDDIDLIWRVRREGESDVVNIKLDKRKDGPEGISHRMRPHRTPGTDSIILVPAPPGSDSDDGRHPGLVEPILRELAAPSAPVEGLSFTRIQALTEGAAGTVKRSLDWLITAELVERVGSGKQTRYRITDSGSLRIRKIDDEQG